MRTVWDVNTAVDCFPVRLTPVHGSAPTKAETVRAIHQMLDTLVREPRALIIDTATLVADFNALLEQVKDQFPGSDTLRIIEPLGDDASVALVAVRLSIVKRTVDAEVARSSEEPS
jgi:hypothetical protein